MRGVALVIFGLTYLLLAVGRLRPFRLDRTGVAIPEKCGCLLSPAGALS